MSDIRVTYSGLLAFVIGLASIFAGLFFIVTVTRTLSPEEFGTWSLIFSMITYFVISERIISFWATRQIARGEEIGNTSAASSILFGFGTIPIYIILSVIVAAQSSVELNILFLARDTRPRRQSVRYVPRGGGSTSKHRYS